MTYAVAYIASLLLFLAIDIVALTQVLSPMFSAALGDMMLDEPRLAAAGLFYLAYVAGIVWFVGAPALAEGRGLGWAFANGALLGGLAYGTYEFTNFATLKGWTATMVAVDVVWGMILTGVVAAGGVAATRAVLGRKVTQNA